MRNSSLFSHVFLILLTGMISACGWQLRGSSYANPLITDLQLKGVDPYSETYKMAASAIKTTGYTFIEPEETGASFILEIDDTDFDTNELARDASLGGNSQMMLTSTVTWSLFGPEDSVIFQQVITRNFKAYQNSSYTDDEFTKDEYDFAREAAEEELMYLILQKLSSVDAEQLNDSIERARELERAKTEGRYAEPDENSQKTLFQ